MTTRTGTNTDASPLEGADDTAKLLGKVMLLVAATIGLSTVGALLGRDFPPAAAISLSFAGLGMLLIQAFGGDRFRVGRFAVSWLFSVGVVIGLGFGPLLAHYTSADPHSITQTAGVTALVVIAMGACGLFMSRDLSRWMSHIAFATFGLVLLAIILVLVGSGENPWLSLLIASVSALLILVDFNYLRHHGTQDDVVLLATGIFVSIVNIFSSVLNIFGRSQE